MSLLKSIVFSTTVCLSPYPYSKCSLLLTAPHRLQSLSPSLLCCIASCPTRRSSLIPGSQKPSGSYHVMNINLLPVIPGHLSSLPISADVVRDIPCCPSRHGSTVMVVDESISPPQSSRQVLIWLELTIDPKPPCGPKASDHSTCISPPRSLPHSLLESVPDQEVDHNDGLLVQPAKPSQPPVRLLDDEEEHYSSFSLPPRL